MKSLFTIHEGEFLVGDHINSEFGKKYEVWVPTKDEGVDLLITRRKGKQRPVRVQVKFSRSFGTNYRATLVPAERFLARGWFTLKPQKVRKSKADLWVFAILTLRHQAHFVLVPAKELRKRIPTKPGKMWNLYLTVFRPKQCYDLRGVRKDRAHIVVLGGKRDKKRDYTEFLENWSLLAQMST